MTVQTVHTTKQTQPHNGSSGVTPAQVNEALARDLSLNFEEGRKLYFEVLGPALAQGLVRDVGEQYPMETIMFPVRTILRIQNVATGEYLKINVMRDGGLMIGRCNPPPEMQRA